MLSFITLCAVAAFYWQFSRWQPASIGNVVAASKGANQIIKFEITRIQAYGTIVNAIAGNPKVRGRTLTFAAVISDGKFVGYGLDECRYAYPIYANNLPCLHVEESVRQINLDANSFDEINNSRAYCEQIHSKGLTAFYDDQKQEVMDTIFPNASASIERFAGHDVFMKHDVKTGNSSIKLIDDNGTVKFKFFLSADGIWTLEANESTKQGRVAD